MKKSSYAAFALGTAAFIPAFIFSKEFVGGVSRGLSLCAETVIPSLFIFMCASTLAGSGEMPPLLKKAVRPFMRLFGLPSDAFPSVILGFFGGYPVGAKTAQSLYLSGKISKPEREKLLSFCISPGIGFSVNAVGISMLNSKKSGIIILASVCISSLLIGIFGRAKSGDIENHERLSSSRNSFGELLVNSVSSCASSMLTVCGFVALFSGIGETLSLLPVDEKAKILISCFSEVTGGCAAASGKMPLPMLAGICAFGGVCVHLQILSICPGTKITGFCFSRLVHCALSTLVCIILLEHFPVELQTVEIAKESFVLNSFSAPASVSLIFLSVLLILDLDNGREMC